MAKRAARALANQIALVHRKGMSPIRVLVEATLPDADFKQKSRWVRAMEMLAPKMSLPTVSANLSASTAMWLGARVLPFMRAASGGVRATIGKSDRVLRLVKQCVVKGSTLIDIVGRL